MIDLTPLDVRKKRGDFRRLLRGYDPEEVDTFMDLVADRFEELVRENLSLKEKNDRMESQLKALEGREKAVQEALVTAQKLREDVKEETRRDAEVLKDQASRSAELTKAEAESEIKRRLADVNAEITRRLGEAESLIRERQFALEELERSRLKFLKSFRGLLEREMDAVDVEESRRPLEETPLELEFRGWMPYSEGDEDDEDTLGQSASGVEVVSWAMDPSDPVQESGEAEPAAGDEADSESTEDQVTTPVEVVSDGLAEPEGVPEEASESQEEPWLEVEAEPEPETEPEGHEPFEVGLQAEEEAPWAADKEPEEVLEDAAPEDASFEDAATEDAAPEAVAAVPGPEAEHDAAPGGFETQVLEAGTLEADPLDAASKGGDDPALEVPDVEDDETPKEPKWLFSLLKKEEEREGRG